MVRQVLCHTTYRFFSFFIILTWSLATFSFEEIRKRCQEYLHTTKLSPIDLCISATEAEGLSEPAQPPLHTGMLVLIPVENMYHFAIVQHQFIDQTSAYVNDCKTEKNIVYPLSDIRTLKFLAQLEFQPHMSHEDLASSFLRYFAPISVTNSLTLQGKIISTGLYLARQS